MKSYLRFIKVVLLHKWYVFIAGRRLKVPLFRLVTHDLTKFLDVEFWDYAQWFYGNKLNRNGFDQVWLHHQNYNDHHWDHWVLRGLDPKIQHASIRIHGIEALPMPMVCVREMVADWFAAGKAYNGAWPNPTDFTWYKQNCDRMLLHPDTEMRIGLVLAEAARWRW